MFGTQLSDALLSSTAMMAQQGLKNTKLMVEADYQKKIGKVKSTAAPTVAAAATASAATGSAHGHALNSKQAMAAGAASSGSSSTAGAPSY